MRGILKRVVLGTMVILTVLLAVIPNAYAFRYLSTLEVVSGPVLSPEALYYSPACDVTAEIVDCGLGHPWEFPPSVAGNIALVERSVPMYFWEKTQNAAAAGALAAIIYNSISGNVIGTLTFVTDIPAVFISDVEGALLLSLLGSGSVIVHLTVGLDLAETPVIESSDSTGATKDTFDLSEDVYVTGVLFAPSTSYDIYVVGDVAPWVDGMAIPSRVVGTSTSVSSNATGHIASTAVWNGPLVVGKYDIVVDVDGNGIYDEGIDALDDSDIQVTAGFNVVPEVPLGTIAASAAMIVALIAYVAVPKWRRKPI